MSHVIWRFLFLVVPIALIAGFLFRPTPIVGVDGDSLAASVGAPVGEVGYRPCAEDGEAWVCTLPGNGEKGSASYSLRVDDLGCWTIEGVSGSGPATAAPEKNEGCVTIADHVEAID